MVRNGTNAAQLHPVLPINPIIQPYWDAISWLKAPSQATRVDATIFHFIAVLTIVTPFPLICYLARRPGTHLYRMALALSTAPILLLFVAAVRWAPPKELPANIFFTMSGMQIAIRMLELGFSFDGAKRVDEVSLGSLRKTEKGETFQTAMTDAFDLAFTMRGLKYEFGRGLKLPRDTRPTHDRTAWTWRTLTHYALPNYIVFDFIHNCFIRSPAIYAIGMEQIDFRDLDWSEKTVIKFLLAILVVTGLSFVYHMVSLFSVVALGTAPDEWPVLFGRPWTASSLHSFWAVEWHQILRRTFLVTGGYPLGFFFGRAGLVLGAFVSSGLLHGLMIMGDGEADLSWGTVSFFTIQALGFVLERLWRRFCGHRVGGIIGTIWVMFWLVVTVEYTGVASTWLRRGAASVTLMPGWMSICNLAFRVLYPDMIVYSLHTSPPTVSTL